MKTEVEQTVKKFLSKYDKGTIQSVKLTSCDDRECYNFEIIGNKFCSSTFASLQSKLAEINHISDFWINAISKSVLVIRLTVVEKRDIIIDNHLHLPVLDVIDHRKLSKA